MNRILIIALTFCTIFAFSSQAQEKKSSSHTMKGYLVDKMCATGIVKKSPDEAMAKAAKHTRECALEESCAASGYGIVSDGNYIKFDKAGDKKANEFLIKSKTVNNIYVEVSGTDEGNTITVASIKEIKKK